MKSLKIASLLSSLYALWLLNYVAEGVTVKVNKCEINNQMEGSLNLKEINIENGKMMGSKVDVHQEIMEMSIKILIRIFNEDDDVMFDQNVDFCSMGSNDLFKSYFVSFQPEFNEGNCPIQPGSYSSGEFEVNVDDAPEGIYKGTFEVMEGSNQITTVNCEAQIE